MRSSLVFGGVAGLTIGAITGWLAFGSALSGIGTGISLGLGICGVLVAYGYEQSK
ncbi:hypothetical protein [uncultured Litoreibacter sp.]|uniref:hypothetical protein n=1 Tax=uncultured Litoreibacter sp. TaxID=1392394 RepID=UPI002628570F|nr:hypothetical protein [uncultured Litoreibacter sp.]